jgi:luciferase family oxidoreductase group 1
LYILGSSLFGARLAAALGLPYAFASHFAPHDLIDAVALYRREFRPSRQLAAPYVIAGLTVIAADTARRAQEHLRAVQRMRVNLLLGKGRTFTDEEADVLLESPAGAQLRAMMTYLAVGTADEVCAYVAKFTDHADADELITVHPAPDLDARLSSITLLADKSGASDCSPREELRSLRAQHS